MSNSCVVRYFYNGRYEGLITPELAEELETQARKQKWEAQRTPYELKLWMLPSSDLY